MSNWHAHGKLLLTGEYLVLEGALALALPLKYGQSFSVKKNSDGLLTWQATYLQKPWFSAKFSLPNLALLIFDKENLALRLQEILLQLQKMKPEVFSDKHGFFINTELEFNPEFGFGSSSTFIANLARWAKVDPFELQKITFGGSGYDIACALSGKPLFFQLRDGKPLFEEIRYKPIFSDKLFFVYLGKKQKSLESIVHFRKNAVFGKNEIEQISQIGKRLIHSENLVEFEELLKKHEDLMSKILNRKTVQELYFPDFPGAVKSLGAWGGDFVLMTSDMGKKELAAYLSAKGLDTIFTFDELILG